jgi:hypothetical protein
MNFGQAIDNLKKSKKVLRAGWNGKGMWLILITDWTIHKDYMQDVVGLKAIPFIAMKTADNCFVPWLASQTDMLAEDWLVNV